MPDEDGSERQAQSQQLTRRALLLGGVALTASGCQSIVGGTIEAAYAAYTGVVGLVPGSGRRRVRYNTNERPGTIVVDTAARYLYFVEEGGMATRYGIGVGREGANFRGRAVIQRKAQWPSWTPTANMIRQDPRLRQFASGQPGGPNNPLGARALYLYRNGRDTMYRLHGTNEPNSIGQAMSSGCIRLMNHDIIHLYERTPIGTPAVVI